jgi:hypothetical protein
MGSLVIDRNFYVYHVDFDYSKCILVVEIENKKTIINITKELSKTLERSAKNIYSYELKELVEDIYLDSLIPAWDNKEKVFYYFGTEKLAEKEGFYENFQNGMYTKTKSAVKGNFKPFTNSYKNRKDVTPYDLGEQSRTHLSTLGLKYTFGVEIETIKGFVPQWVYKKHILAAKCERDGSLKNPDGSETGGEYITGVLAGDDGLFNLKKLLQQLSLRCEIDKRCGIHVHVGGMNFSDENIVLAYILATMIQDEVFQTLPLSRRNNDTCGLLPQQNYKEYLRKYNIGNGSIVCFEDLFEKVANGRKMDNVKVCRTQPHPGGRYTDRYSRGIPCADLYRYKWLNFVPAIFNMKGKVDKPIYTLEFRCHPGSLNFVKIKNWILFCFAFCNFVENYKERIVKEDKITIKDILTAVYGKKGLALNEYFEERKNSFKDLILAEKREKNDYKQKTLNKPLSKKIMIEEV